ncbi:MAG: M14 family zinc carboxypeptidase, partial [Clostridiales bacterium]
MKNKIILSLLMSFMLSITFSIPVFAQETGSLPVERGNVAAEEPQSENAALAQEQNNDATATENQGENPILPENNQTVAPEETWPTEFADVKPGEWYYDAIKFATEKRICKGVDANNFSPNSSLTRAMLVTMMYRYAGSPAVEGSVNFPDINTGEYYYKALIWATNNKIITGFPDGTFKPNTEIIRQDVATILSRFCITKGIAINGWLDLFDFNDAWGVLPYSQKSMQWAYSYGIMNGNGSGYIEPTGNATRAECAALIHRFNGIDLTKVPTSAPSLFNGNHVVHYDAMCEYLNTMTNMYPNIIKVSSAGKSEEGRDIKLVKLGTGNRYIYMQGNLHAREYISLNYLLEILDTYAHAYTTNTAFDGYNVRDLLSKFTIVMIPCANPDGQNIAIYGYNAAGNPSAVKGMYNPSGSHTDWKSNSQGVDLNRNFNCKWSTGSVKRPSNANYGGPRAESAVETRNIVNVLRSYPFETALDCHTAGDLIYYSDNACSSAYNAKAAPLASKLAAASNYKMQKTSVGAGAANYVRHTF